MSCMLAILLSYAGILLTKRSVRSGSLSPVFVDLNSPDECAKGRVARKRGVTNKYTGRIAVSRLVTPLPNHEIAYRYRWLQCLLQGSESACSALRLAGCIACSLPLCNYLLDVSGDFEAPSAPQLARIQCDHESVAPTKSDFCHY